MIPESPRVSDQWSVRYKQIDLEENPPPEALTAISGGSIAFVARERIPFKKFIVV